MQALLDAGTVYYTAVQSIIPMADMGELSFRGFYKTVRRRGDPPAQEFLLGFDSEPIRAEKSLYDLAGWARSDPSLVSALLKSTTPELAECLRTGSAPAGVDRVLWQEWRFTFQEHLDLYGHAVYNLDFATPVPADNPAAQLETVKFYLRGQGTDPHERQRLLTERRESLTREVAGRLGPRRRALFLRLLKWAQETAPLREDALADVGLAWPLLRRMLLELGRRLVASSVIAAPDDVFWLRFSEPAECSGVWPGGARRRGFTCRCVPARPGCRRRGAQDAVARPGKGRRPADAPAEGVDGEGVRFDDAGRPAAAGRRHDQGHRCELRPGHRTGAGPAGTRGLRPDAAR
ncbi:hypothetical protein NG819_19950 [Pseudarthrobacter sp. Fe7]|nr:hypothetical protein NG819_19950 [Pseudarthrobacter sp. Fe7]